MYNPIYFLFFLIAFSGSCNRSAADIDETHDPVKKVQIVRKCGQFQLLRDGAPYFIKGAAGYKYLDRLKAYGGNSMRVWHTENAQQVLDSAHAHGLTVTLGLWLGRERDGFNYYNKKMTAHQLQELKQVVLQYKDHPALLMWGVGNEVYADGANVKVWDAVNEIAQMIHEVDPHHPTTTTIMNVERIPINMIKQKCPAIDVLSINIFGALFDLRDELAKSNWNGPYIVSEYGARGYWESFFTEWVAPIEQTSSAKVSYVEERYKNSILQDSARCLGAYIFMWDNKYETTQTWYSLFTEDGEETGLVGLMRELWSGALPENRAPYLAYLTLDDKYAEDNIYLKPGQLYTGAAIVSDPEGDALRLRWEVLPETISKDGTADKEIKPKPVDGVLQRVEDNRIQLMAPSKPGAYRLFVYVADDHNNVATANLPFFVRD